MRELDLYNPEQLSEDRKKQLMLLICDESSIKCSTFRRLQQIIMDSEYDVLLVMPDSQYQKGLRGWAKAHIISSVSNRIRGVMPLGYEDVIKELDNDWGAIRVNDSANWTSVRTISRGTSESHALVITETSEEGDREMIMRARNLIESSNCWLDPAGVVFTIEGQVLVEATSTSFNDSHCTTIPVSHKDLHVREGERMVFCDSLHAERVGISLAASQGISLYGSTMYVSKFPCRPCAQSAIAAGVSTIVYESNSYGLIETADIFKGKDIALKRVVK